MPIISSPQETVNVESIILSTDLRAQIKLMLTQNNYPSIGDLLIAVQTWLHDQNKHLTDGYVFSHVMDIINDATIQVINWDYPERTIRCFMTDEQLVQLSYDYDELPMYLKSMGIPVVQYNGGRFIYFMEVYPEHLALLTSYGANFENKL